MLLIIILSFQANEALARLEIDLELQDKITKAALKLAQDKSVAKSVRKQRKQQYHKAHQKVRKTWNGWAFHERTLIDDDDVVVIINIMLIIMTLTLTVSISKYCYWTLALHSNCTARIKK